MSCGGLWHLVMWLGFYGMYQIWKFNTILDKENRHVIAYQIPVAFFGIKLSGKTAYVTYSVGRTPKAHYGGKAYENRSFLVRIVKQFCFCKFWYRPIALKISMCCGTSGVYHTFWYALMVKMCHLFPKMEILHNGRASVSGF